VDEDEDLPQQGRELIRTSARLAAAALLLPACVSEAEPDRPATPSAIATSNDAGGPREPKATPPKSPLETSTTSRAFAPPPAPAQGDVLRTIDGRALTKSDLGDFVLRYLPDAAATAMERLVDEAIVEAEARRESVAVSAALVAERADAYVEERRKDARVEFGADVNFEKLVAERYGRDLAAFRADAERLVRTSLLADRLVRLEEFRKDGVETRVVVFADENAARDAVKRLRAGADMTRVAADAGARPPSSPAPIARGDVAERALEERLFAATTGEVLDPIPFVEGGRTWWQVFMATRAWKGADLPWTALARRVEESLRGSPVTREEYERWRARAGARHGEPEAKGSVRTAAGE